MMFLTVLLGGDFSMAKKGLHFTQYTPELKREVVRLETGRRLII
ncbi:hypothetical protein SAMN04487943_101245 [Gracilibacillus orientalis]|uniref:Uncharacterized protein n=1 Tax=Gracilibacillus orientalis TaxID=334253 RepID=A0A1I4H7P1_9BACI|nr:hypothetical protein SAMN04487943_101245 [Gracilibacillus orientalis]